MYTTILDSHRQSLLPKLVSFKETFYLAGGTALALQIGHRLSIDFDFFTESEFDPNTLFGEVEAVFTADNHKVVQVQNEKNTLSVFIDGVKLSFFYTPYPLLNALIESDYLRLASMEDIGCFKLAAILSRATNKDYIDLYYILQDIALPELLAAAHKKMPTIDENLLLKSLVYFKDVEEEEIIFMEGKEVSLTEIEAAVRKVVREYMKQSL